MSTTKFEIEALNNDITENSLKLKAIIQDLYSLDQLEPVPKKSSSVQTAELYNLNAKGRRTIASIRDLIGKFDEIAKDEKNPKLLKEVTLFREQLASDFGEFKKANIEAMRQIEKNYKRELIEKTESSLRQRTQKRDKENLVKQSSNITDQLLSISRQLADTTKQSADTLDSLKSSSDTAFGTQEELKVTGSAITQSGKLLSKYGRREFTDKILVCFAFLFFLSCVVYIVQKRLF